MNEMTVFDQQDRSVIHIYNGKSVTKVYYDPPGSIFIINIDNNIIIHVVVYMVYIPNDHRRLSCRLPSQFYRY